MLLFPDGSGTTILLIYVLHQMQRKKSHIDQALKKKLEVLPDLNLDYNKSKDEVWESLSHSIDASGVEPSGKLVDLFSGRMWLAAAAIIAVLLGTILFMRLYTASVYAPLGQHELALLPDGSKVKLNAGSSINYHPYWWRFNRELNMEGEAYFEVEKGKQFQVISPAGQTIVLGTSFNIFARGDQYRVTCFTGKVKVIANQSGHSLNIVPNEQATLNSDGSLRLSKIQNLKDAASWMNDMFVFTGTPLSNVFEEIERQYNVTIGGDEGLGYLYTGNFSRAQPVEQVLKMVCKPYGLTFRKTDKGFVIVNNRK